ncbi:MAG: hydroxymethylglutaryl-CoA reductase, degradative, partial [Alkalibacterium sp.]|nr:hydroxymethylglutaryl-CoA reductase, degradative [Alkalibacterium sp.]
MIENYIFNYELPFGLAMNFLVDGNERVIPMVTEEPSVIAAASNAGKLTQSLGGFTTDFKNRLVIGQIVLKEVKEPEKARKILKENESELIHLANQAYPSILDYGAGAQKIKIRRIQEDDSPEFFVLHLMVDTGEAMGANIVNTMTEAIASHVVNLVGGGNLMNILSNYATESIVKASCIIHPENLENENMSGEEVRDRIIEASQFAYLDPYRAVTHNKGIMNGIDALLVASGNDWRAVEAGVHAYAAKSGQYRALSQWTKTKEGYLKGEIELPISIGTVGGTLSVHPAAQLAHRIMNHPSAKEFSRLLAAVGLAQNLAALKALVTDGIQKGHMALQARTLAISVGAKGAVIDQVVKQLKKSKTMNSKIAKEILVSILEEN